MLVLILNELLMLGADSMRLPLMRRKKDGDTIIEVLIAIAIISSLLVGAFTVMRHSGAAIRDSQEHAEMIQILQSQVEYVRSIAFAQKQPAGGIFASGNFCIDSTDSANPLPVAAGNPVCHNISSLYNVSINYDTTRHVYVFVGTWNKLGGGTAREEFVYRIY
jgi:type II secretory pathway pseudopilin PulG